MKLSKFPERFPQLKETASCKGVFLYRFNKKENYGYEGPVPAEEHFLDKFATPEDVVRVKAFRKTYGDEGKDDRYTITSCKIFFSCAAAASVRQAQEYFAFQEELEKKADIPFHCWSKPFFTASSVARPCSLSILLPGEGHSLPLGE